MSVPKFTGRPAGGKVLCKHSLFWPRPVAHCLFQPGDLMTVQMVARFLERQGVTQPPHSAWKPVGPCSQTALPLGTRMTVLAGRSETALVSVGKINSQEAKSPPGPHMGTCSGVSLVQESVLLILPSKPIFKGPMFRDTRKYEVGQKTPGTNGHAVDTLATGFSQTASVPSAIWVSLMPHLPSP